MNKLLDIFWRQIDPTDSGGQFFDRGESYETAIFTIQKSKRHLLKNRKKRLKHPVNLLSRLQRKFYRPKHFIQQKKGIKIIIRKIQHIIIAIQLDQVENNSKSDNWRSE